MFQDDRLLSLVGQQLKELDLLLPKSIEIIVDRNKPPPKLKFGLPLQKGIALQPNSPNLSQLSPSNHNIQKHLLVIYFIM